MIFFFFDMHVNSTMCIEACVATNTTMTSFVATTNGVRGILSIMELIPVFAFFVAWAGRSIGIEYLYSVAVFFVVAELCVLWMHWGDLGRAQASMSLSLVACVVASLVTRMVMVDDAMIDKLKADAAADAAIATENEKRAAAALEKAKVVIERAAKAAIEKDSEIQRLKASIDAQGKPGGSSEAESNQ